MRELNFSSGSGKVPLPDPNSDSFFLSESSLFDDKSIMTSMQLISNMLQATHHL